MLDIAWAPSAFVVSKRVRNVNTPILVIQPSCPCQDYMTIIIYLSRVSSQFSNNRPLVIASESMTEIRAQ